MEFWLVRRLGLGSVSLDHLVTVEIKKPVKNDDDYVSSSALTF